MELRCRKRPRIDTSGEKALRPTNDCSTLALSEDKIANHFSCNGVSNAITSDNNRSEPSCMMLAITRFNHHSTPDGKMPSPLRAIGLTSPDKLTKNGCLSQHNGYHSLPLVSANGLTASVVKVNVYSSVVGRHLSDPTQPIQNGDSCRVLSNRRMLRAARTKVCDGIEVGNHDGNTWTDTKDGNGGQLSPALAETRLGPKESPKIEAEQGQEPEHKAAIETTSTDLCQQARDIRKLNHLCKDKNSSSASSSSSLSSTSGFGGGSSVVPSAKDKATCQWNGCGEDIEADSLLEHMTQRHIVSQAKASTDEETKFVCLWNGCKFYNRSSVLQTWLERHVLCHLGNKPYRCIVPHCRMRFASQFLLKRHVNGHLDQSRPPRKGDTAAARQMRKRKLRNTKPCPVRTDDYFDSMTMESIQNELVRSTQLTQVDLLHSGNTLTFHSSILARRVESSGRQETLLRWRPRNLLPDQWVPESQVASYARQVVPLSSLPSDVLRMLTLPPRPPHQGHSSGHRKNRRK